ncbi:class I SAM-dependent methyltransferase [Flectobacillus longus]|uniref:class I SAM-dependent methyltransferase n=1 Tax=Flectobacillus longus TaxID=2984207 RepID=UPI0024B69C4B|nr:SAM-dependent methyltransferase [Flectobacillus longus]MDI9879834.1 SAM-dependent methyltransferase [Flectobacillus longus]
MKNQIAQFCEQIQQAVEQKSLVKVSLGNYQGNEPALKNIYIRLVLIKNIEKLAFTFRYKTKDIVKNFDLAEGYKSIAEWLEEGFKVATLMSTESDWQYEALKNGKVILKQKAASVIAKPSLEHDKEKKRLIKPTEKAYLVDLKITDEQGNVFKNAQDKYRQINHYVEILSSLIKDSAIENLHKVVDMGSGKGYLTFALYDYLHNTLGLKTQVQGVEYRQDMVDLCNQFAHKAGFEGLSFTQGTILDYEQKDISMLIALHACDTATDDAIYKGLQSSAELIVVAPCCHKQIRREIEKNKAQNELKFLTKYGIFLERQAEMVTDGIRALILEYFGYKTKVFEFISDAHTPKNVLVVGIKSGINPKRQEEILQEIAQTKAYFGIDYHHLEKLTQLSL